MEEKITVKRSKHIKRAERIIKLVDEYCPVFNALRVDIRVIPEFRFKE